MSGLDHRLEPKRDDEVRRFEVINGAMGRRRWSDDARAQILEETLLPGVVISAVARRHGLSPQQLFTWRREARVKAETSISPEFVPAVIAPELAAEEKTAISRATRSLRTMKRGSLAVTAIELDIDGVTVRIGDGARPATVAAVIRALKTTP